MAIEHNGKIIRSLPEQVAKNLTDIIKLMADITALTNLVNSKLTGAMHYKGSVATVADLPSTGNEIGDFYNVTSTGENYAWDGTQWDNVGSIVDLAPYARKDQNNTFTANNVFTGDIAVDSIYDTLDGVIFEVSDIDQKIAGTGYTIFPNIDTSYDLGTSTRRWDSIYLAGELSDGTNSVDVADIVTTDTEQTITGAKSFNAKKLRIQEGTQFWTFDMDSGGSYLDIMYNGTNTVMSITRTAVVSRQKFHPQNDNDIDLGLYYKRWKDLYLSGKLSDGTNSLTIADISNRLINIINASDIVGNTVTQAQYDLITNGKPTIINGTILTYSNIIILTAQVRTSYVRCLAIGNGTVMFEFSINISTKEIDAIESGLSLQSIYAINGKNIPTYPSNTGTFVLKCVDGTLTWVAE